MTKIKQIVGLQTALDNRMKVTEAAVAAGTIPKFADESGALLEQGFDVIEDMGDGKAKTHAEIPTSLAVKDYIDLIVSAVNALTYKETLFPTSNPGDVEAPAAEIGDLFIIGSEGVIGTVAQHSATLEKGWWLICKKVTAGGAWDVTEWDIVEMDYSEGLQQLLSSNMVTGLGPSVAAAANTNHMVASIGALNPAPFMGVPPTCHVNGVSLIFVDTPQGITHSPGIFWIAEVGSVPRLHVNLPYALDNEDRVTLCYCSI